MTRLAVAAISARVLAEAAALEGFEVVALDLFGDLDTRRAAASWQPIGMPGTLHVDGERLLQALAALARNGGVQGWVAGAGFDGRPELLAAGARCLPLLGNPAEAVAGVRDPRRFFAALDRHGLAHPALQFAPPAEPAGWLRKDAAGCGGWHIRAARADEPPLLPTQYFQRECGGVPMSATFVADGRSAVLLGCNEQLVQSVVGHRYVYGGVIGPLPVAAALRAQWQAALDPLVAEFGLRGLGSLDGLLDGERIDLLELNPRPPASLALYAGRTIAPLAAHLRACAGGALPVPPVAGAPRGQAIAFARRPLRLSEAAAAWLAAQPDTHDLPAAGTAFAPGDPVCSVGAAGADADTIRAQLRQRRAALLDHLENDA